ncbi:transcriptional regulator domain-containing protein [Bradyrhizobium sp. I1.14.4]|uniref:transcriptional regulator domain-containing protein n=1 Tax=unclassified Bradyrhizobium TaxID=2631580 RepID=UPI003D236037
MSGADWRSESAYHEVKKAETPDVAWEWLRRDREYQKDFSALVSSEKSSVTANGFRGKWGLFVS